VDLVVLSIGVRPESQLAKDADLGLNSRGYITVNDYMQTTDPSIYAVGDVIETQDLVFPDRKATVALGNIANMQARIAADHIVLGKSIPYKGSLGTSIVRAFDTVLALTGWNEKRLKAAGIPYATTTITENSHAGYYPGALPITLKITYDPATGRVYGGQAGKIHVKYQKQNVNKKA
jgi:NADPH-dependent 2,4-dienoyl-CoA reductase/sulfur reductase-like enzyme